MKQILLMSFFGLFSASLALAQTRIDTPEVEKMLKEDSTIQLVDLRTPAEWQQTGVIPGAKLINFNAPDFKRQIGQLNRLKPVIVYCAAGGRSNKAVAIMGPMGFKNVYEYANGMNDWIASNKKTVKP